MVNWPVFSAILERIKKGLIDNSRLCSFLRRNQEKSAIYQIVVMITFHRCLYPWQRILPSGTGCIHPLEQMHEDHVLLY